MILNNEQMEKIRDIIEESLTEGGHTPNAIDKAIIRLSVESTVLALSEMLNNISRSSGVKDINGVEIYEGANVIKRNEYFKHGVMGVITFERGAFRFNGETLEKTEETYMEKGYVTFNNTYEVVPTVIENI